MEPRTPLVAFGHSTTPQFGEAGQIPALVRNRRQATASRVTKPQ